MGQLLTVEQANFAKYMAAALHTYGSNKERETMQFFLENCKIITQTKEAKDLDPDLVLDPRLAAADKAIKDTSMNFAEALQWT
ncbi:MAG TPA: hypothetical protein VIY47_12345, partial [Ignavibacteriaceae bacterium]